MSESYNIPSEIRPKLISFETAFVNSMQAMPPDWLSAELVESMTAGPDTLIARFPVPIQAAEYKEFLGTVEFRELSAKFFDMSFKEWVDAVAEKVVTLMSNQWTGWGSQPAAMALASRTLELKAAALALEAGTTIVNWDDLGTGAVNFFDTQHPINPTTGGGGVQSNILTGMTPSNANFDRIRDRFRDFRAPNGERMGLEWTGLLYPAGLASSIENIIAPNTNGVQIVAPDGEINPFRWRGKVWGRYVPHFSSDTVYYAVATNRPDIKPLAAMRKLAPQRVDMATGRVTVGSSDIETIVYDMSDTMYKQTGKVGIQKRKYYAARTAHHLAIIRCEV
jgi:hypothetical protein